MDGLTLGTAIIIRVRDLIRAKETELRELRGEIRDTTKKKKKTEETSRTVIPRRGAFIGARRRK